MPGTPPFTDAGVTEIIARVAYQVIARDFRLNPARYDNPIEGIYTLMREMRHYDNTLLHTSFAAILVHLRGQRGTLKQWRDLIIHRSRYAVAKSRAGFPWSRACDPPISNTGVAGDDIALLEAVEPRRRKTTKKGRKAYGY